MKREIIATVAVVVIGASCAHFTPAIDPSGYPCGSPLYEWCPGRKTCCLTNEICRPDGWCAANEVIPTIRAKQRPADAGADAPRSE